MVTNPGQTIKGMAEGVVRVDKLGKEVAKDIKDIADSNKSASARAAAAASAGKKISNWLSAIIVVATIIAFIFNPALALKVWLLRAMALMIVGAALALVESELRIQEALEAKTLEEFKAAVQKAGSAQAEFIAAVALAAVPLIGRILAKIPVIGKVVTYLGSVTKFGAGKLWTLRNAIAKQLRTLAKGSEAAVKAEGVGTAQLARKLEAMKGKEFLDALENDKDLREALGFDAEMIKSLEELLETPEGHKVIDQLHAELTRSVADAPDLAQRLIEDYNVKLEEAAQNIENAKTPDEVKAAVDEARRVLGERAAAREMTSLGEDYKGQRQWEAAEKARLEQLEKEAAAIRAQEAAQKAAADKAAADKATAEQAAEKPPTKTPPAEKPPAEKRPAEKPPAEKPADKPDVAPAENAPGVDQSPLSDIKPEDIVEAIKEEAKVEPSRRMTWEDAAAQKLDKRSVPADVKKAGLAELWKEWVDYVRGRLKQHGKGAHPRKPLTWDAYKNFLGKFRRGRVFQEKFTEKLSAEVGESKIVQQDVGVVSEQVRPAVEAGTEGVKFSDQVVSDKAAVERFAKGEGPAPDVDTFSNKSRDFQWHADNGTLTSIVAADVAEVLTKYSGEITIRRPGPLQGVKVQVNKATLVYDAAGIPAKLLNDVQGAFKAASQGKVTLRVERLP